MKAISLFSSAGVGETYLDDIDIEVVCGVEIIEKRGMLFKHLYPEKGMVIGDLREQKIKDKVGEYITDDIELLIATPPCQGVSSVGKNKTQDEFISDERNFLINDVFYFIDKFDFGCILIENVSKFLKMYFPYKGEMIPIKNLIEKRYGQRYEVEVLDINAENYGVPQSRPRCFIKLYNSRYSWAKPVEESVITLHEAIGHLPSLEAGEDSGIKWHSAKMLNERDIEAMRHTPTGQSAMRNEFYYPKTINGGKVRGFHNTYKRLEWDKPCHARTTKSGEISSHNNGHPGRIKKNGTYSDARVLTILELLIVSSLPEDWNIPNWASERFIRHVIGESVPPRLLAKVLETLEIKAQ